MTDRERRLPKWALSELQQLRRENRRLREEIEAAEPPDSNTFAHDYGARTGMGPRLGLARGERITFYLGTDTDNWNQRIDARVEDGRLRIMGGDSVLILPESSNTFSVQMR